MAQIRVLLASASFIKKSAVINYFRSNHPGIKPIIECLDCDACLPAQPITCGAECAALRMAYAIATYQKPYDMVISIESDLLNVASQYYDTAHIRIFVNGIIGVGIDRQHFSNVSSVGVDIINT